MIFTFINALSGQIMIASRKLHKFPTRKHNIQLQYSVQLNRKRELWTEKKTKLNVISICNEKFNIVPLSAQCYTKRCRNCGAEPGWIFQQYSENTSRRNRWYSLIRFTLMTLTYWPSFLSFSGKHQRRGNFMSGSECAACNLHHVW